MTDFSRTCYMNNLIHSFTSTDLVLTNKPRSFKNSHFHEKTLKVMKSCTSTTLSLSTIEYRDYKKLLTNALRKDLLEELNENTLRNNHDPPQI